MEKQGYNFASAKQKNELTNSFFIVRNQYRKDG